MTAICHTAATAQVPTAAYAWDFGAGAGMSGYIGDANRANPFKHPGFTADLTGRYIIDSRWAVRASLGMATLSGNTSEVVLPNGANGSFNTTLCDLSVRGEANFLPYGKGETYKRLRNWTPYLALGAGLDIAFTNGSTYVAPAVPMAFGFKYKPAERLNLYAEFCMTKVFCDHIDDLSDPNQIKTDFYKATDWVSRISVGFSYEFGKRCDACHYVD